MRTLHKVLMSFWGILVVAGCTSGHDNLVSEPVAGAREVAGIPEFPAGRYVHIVSLDVRGHGSHQLRGVLKLADDSINLIGLSPLGTTVFRIDDKFGAEQVGIEIFQPELKKHADKILGFYRQLRPLLAGRRLSTKEYQEKAPEGWDVRFYENQKEPPLPPTIAVRTEKFSLNIEVDQYEP